MSPKYHFCEYSTQGTCWCLDVVVSCIMCWNIKQLFIHKSDLSSITTDARKCYRNWMLWVAHANPHLC